MGQKNINFVEKAGLCHFCGTCYGVCPKDNIRWHPSKTGNPVFRVVSEDKCGGCDLCYQVCPGHAVDFKSLHRAVFSTDFHFGWLGTFISCALAHSADPFVRCKAASGGAVSSLLSDALASGAIDGAIVVRQGAHGYPFQVQTVIARTGSEILAACGSKYRTVPVGMRLRDVCRSSKEERFAFVGLPCHVHGLRKAQQLIPRLRRRIGPVISLFCGRGTSPLGTEFVLKRLKLRKEEVVGIEYRRGKWPGGFAATLQSGEVRFLPLDDYVFIMKMFQNVRCIMCVDHTGEFADVSAGDAWLSELRGEEGWNAILIRTPLGYEMVEAARHSGRLTAYSIDSSRIIASQRLMLYDKKIKIFPSMKLANRLGLAATIPRYTGVSAFQKAGLHDYLRAAVFMTVPRLSASSTLKHLLTLALKAPKKILMMDFKGKHREVETAVMGSHRHT